MLCGIISIPNLRKDKYVIQAFELIRTERQKSWMRLDYKIVSYENIVIEKENELKK